MESYQIEEITDSLTERVRELEDKLAHQEEQLNKLIDKLNQQELKRVDRIEDKLEVVNKHVDMLVREVHQHKFYGDHDNSGFG